MKLRLKLPSRTKPQRRADDAKTRFTLSLWGRQSGKTTGGYRKMLWKPLLGRRDGIYWHVLQTYSAARVVFRRYLRLVKPFRKLIIRGINRSELSVTLIGNRTIFFKSGHNFEDLRTESLDGVIIDEARQQREELWTTVIFPMLAKTKGWADIMSSPNGYDWLFDLYNKVKDDPMWTVIRAPSSEAWWWTEDELGQAKKTMNELEYKQEIEAEFVNLRAGKVYWAFSDLNKREDCPFLEGKPWSPWHSIILGCDFNVHPMCWTLGQYATEKWWWFDEINLQQTHTDEASDALVTKILTMREHGFRGNPDLIICGDASGKASSTKSNQSDYDIIKAKLKKAGITFKDITPEANPSIKDRINAVNAQCKSADQAVHMFVHKTNCKNLINDFERVTWKPGADFILDSGPQKMLTHASDGVGYPISKLSPVLVQRAAGAQKVIAARQL